MAKVRLTDIIDVEVYRDLASENKPEKLALFESGVVIRDQLADNLANADGMNSEMPFWLDLDPTSEPNYSTDQDTLATPEKVSQAAMNARKSFLNKGYSAMDLAREVQTGTDAMRHIKNRVDTYWQRQWQRRLVAICKGIFNANVAGNVPASGAAGDSVVDVSLQTTAGQTAANKFSRSVFTQALFTMGDYADQFRAILVHPVVMKNMIDAEDVDFILDAEGRATIPTYMGLRIVVDESAPVIAGTTSGFRYVSILFGRAAFIYGEGQPIVPVEVARVAASGNGGGEETFWTRKTWLIHPLGHKNNGASLAADGINQNLTNLATASNWTRTHYRKNVPIAFLVTNG